MAGFYRSRYTPKGEASPSVARDEEHHYMFSTQLESCDARRAFPCFDEPNLKASLEFSIEIPEDQTALSNMPEKETAVKITDLYSEVWSWITDCRSLVLTSAEIPHRLSLTKVGSARGS